MRKVINRNLGSVSILPTFCNIIERAFNTQIYGKNEKTLKLFSFKHELQYFNFFVSVSMKIAETFPNVSLSTGSVIN